LIWKLQGAARASRTSGKIGAHLLQVVLGLIIDCPG
jgi:hypothetical protein